MINIVTPPDGAVEFVSNITQF